MRLQEELLDLSDTVRRVSSGINAVQVMTMGLGRASDPYADGFGAICDYLLQADQDLQKHLEACLKAV